MRGIEAKLNHGVVLVVDNDAGRRAAIADTVIAAFVSPVIQQCAWLDHLRPRVGLHADLAILTPERQTPGEPDALVDILRTFSATPTIVLTDPAEPQRAVNAVLEGASDALVMEPSYLQLLPSHMKRAMTRAHFQNVLDRRSESTTSYAGTRTLDTLHQTRQENTRLRSRLVTLRAAALLDPLTGLANRRALDSHLSRLWDAATLCDTDVSCLVVDVDNFKRLNDTHGHALGDRVLTLVAMILLEQCRQDDIAARMGGDEFVVLLPGASTEQAEQVASRIQHGFHAALPRLNIADPCTLSIGVASRKRNLPARAEDLIVHADEAMYIAKRAGKNRVELGVRTGAPAPRLASAG